MCEFGMNRGVYECSPTGNERVDQPGRHETESRKFGKPKKVVSPSIQEKSCVEKILFERGAGKSRGK